MISPHPPPPALPSAEWQADNGELAAQAEWWLWHDEGADARQRLVTGWGFNEDTLLLRSIGYIPPGSSWPPDPSPGVTAAMLPAGFTMPCFRAGGPLVRLALFGQRDGNVSRRMRSGSNAEGIVMGAPADGLPLVVVASEADAALIYQEAGGIVSVVAMGDPATPPDAALWQIIAAAPAVVYLGGDEVARDTFARWWSGRRSALCRWPIPADYGADGSVIDARRNGLPVFEWIYAALDELGMIPTSSPPAGDEDDGGPPPPAEDPPADEAGGMAASLAGIVGEEIVLAGDGERRNIVDGRVVYRETELRRLAALGPEDRRQYHAARKIFGGRLVTIGPLPPRRPAPTPRLSPVAASG
jgi:hypothetical protein